MDTARPNAFTRTKHSAQRHNLSRQRCLNASARTHFGLRFGPKMCRPGQSAHPPACPPARPSCPPRAQPTMAPRHFPTPHLCCPASCDLLSPRRRRHGCHRCPLAAPTAKKNRSFHLSLRPSRAVAVRRCEDHRWVACARCPPWPRATYSSISQH
jgi:hypothetical protein